MNKKEWREYATEEGNNWAIFSNADAIEKETDFTTDEGEEAILCMKFVAVDYVVVSFIPCARNRMFNNRDVNFGSVLKVGWRDFSIFVRKDISDGI